MMMCCTKRSHLEKEVEKVQQECTHASRDNQPAKFSGWGFNAVLPSRHLAYVIGFFIVLVVLFLTIYFHVFYMTQTILTDASKFGWEAGKVVITVPRDMAKQAKEFYADKQITGMSVVKDVKLWKGVHKDDLLGLAEIVAEAADKEVPSMVKSKFMGAIRSIKYASEHSNMWTHWSLNVTGWGSVGSIGFMTDDSKTMFNVYLGFKEANFTLQYKHFCGWTWPSRSCTVNLDDEVIVFLQNVWRYEIADYAAKAHSKDIELQLEAPAVTDKEL